MTLKEEKETIALLDKKTRKELYDIIDHLWYMYEKVRIKSLKFKLKK